MKLFGVLMLSDEDVGKIWVLFLLRNSPFWKSMRYRQ